MNCHNQKLVCAYNFCTKMILLSGIILCCSISLEKYQGDPDDDSDDDSGIGTSTFTVTKSTTFSEVHSFYHSL